MRFTPCGARDARVRLGSEDRIASTGSPPRSRSATQSGELRLWCERPSRAAISPTVLVLGEATGPRAHPGGAVSTLFSVEEDCVADEVRVEVRGRPPAWGEERFDLVAPDGSEHRVARWVSVESGGDPKIVATVTTAAGRASAGLWELRMPRAGADVVLDGASLAFECRR